MKYTHPINIDMTNNTEYEERLAKPAKDMEEAMFPFRMVNTAPYRVISDEPTRKIYGKRVDVRTAPKISRNAECPCGSGLKYKKCCINKTVEP